MDTIQLNISKQQFVGLIQSMPEKDRLKIFDRLRKSLFVCRFNRLLKSTRTDELSLEDIPREVEAVRKERYEGQKNRLWRVVIDINIFISVEIRIWVHRHTNSHETANELRFVG